MDTGKREDLKAIWFDVSKWEVEGYGGTFRFSKALDGKMGWWEKNGGIAKGLEAFIDKTRNEWDEELIKIQDAQNLALLGIE